MVMLHIKFVAKKYIYLHINEFIFICSKFVCKLLNQIFLKFLHIHPQNFQNFCENKLNFEIVMKAHTKF